MAGPRPGRAQIAAHESWAHTPDRSSRTAPARQAFNDRFEQQVDPDGKLTPAERAKRAEHAKRAYFLRLALKSAKTRRARAESKLQPDPLARIAELERLAAGGDAG